MANIIDTANLSIDDTITTTRGSKIARIREGKDKNCIYMPNSQLRVPFAPSSFDAANKTGNMRLNLQLSIEDADTLRELEKFDRWIVEYLAEHSERLLKRKLTKEQVQSSYLSCLKPSAKEGFAPLLKTKIDLDGLHAVHCWDQDGNDKGQVPHDEWRGNYIEARVHISHLWQMAGQCGVVMRLTDAKFAPRAPDEVTKATRSYPWGK
jgi:hypothetical protein